MKFSFTVRILIFSTIGIMLQTSCNNKIEPTGEALYTTYCASCHLLPSIQDLPKGIWKNQVLPEMGARLGMVTKGYEPYKNLPFEEQEAILKTGIYPDKPLISAEEWKMLQDYVIENAPNQLKDTATVKEKDFLTGFKENILTLDDSNLYNATYLHYDSITNRMVIGNIKGALSAYSLSDHTNTVLGQFRSPISDACLKNDKIYATTIGILVPSEIAKGAVIEQDYTHRTPLISSLHRPVHNLVHDMDRNGTDEFVISEFGDLTGKLTISEKNKNGVYTSKTLLNQPGCIRVIAADMNNDSKDDLVVLTAQGDEGITILYQEEPLQFRVDKVLQFSPVYGTSWFELVDFNGDGYKDILTVHGDNADKSFVQKPYHGMRIHLNDGNNAFSEAYFYPLHGATRIIAKDFDEDGDMDISLLSTFPDYEKEPEATFVYLENIGDAKTIRFRGAILRNALLNRWFLMDSGDVDSDGDQDIILSSLNYSFTPVPDTLKTKWDHAKSVILILENKLN